MTTQLRTSIHLSHAKLLRKIRASSGLPTRSVVERALELLAENTLRDPKARALLKDIQNAENDYRASRTISLKAYEQSRRLKVWRSSSRRRRRTI